MSSRNRHSQELREQTTTQDSNCHKDSAAQNYSGKNTCLTM